jgi:spore photoproduct lyase
MNESARSEKRTKFGGTKYVYPRPVMADLRTWFTDAVADRLPQAPLLYWT